MAKPSIDPNRVWVLPGWQGSGPAHWQSRWELRHGFHRVEQADWLWPRRGDWMARLDEVVQAAVDPVVLVAHSLGCQLVAAWAAHSSHRDRVAAALLVAPADTERGDMPPNLYSWRPVFRGQLPFASLLISGHADPYCEITRAAGFAADWGSTFVSVETPGHINEASGVGDWDEGHALLLQLVADKT